MVRPIYVGIGECLCGAVDVRLHLIPGTPFAARPICSRCVVIKGYPMPRVRTADDIEMVDGHPHWKEEWSPSTGKEPLVHVGQLALGHGHFFETVLDKDESLLGWLHTHPDARNPDVLCQSICVVREFNGAPVHQILCADPLTLTPSLLCRICGAHGEVINGKWEPR